MLNLSGVLGFALTLLGVVGYCLEPPKGYVGKGEYVVGSACIYHLLLSFFLTLHVFGGIANNRIIETMELVLMFCFLVIISYGTLKVSEVWEFNIGRLKDPILYGSVAYLMTKSVQLPIIVAYLTIVLLSAIIAMACGFAYINLRRIRFSITYRYEIAHTVYLTTMFIGMVIWTNGIVPCLVVIGLISYSLYLIYTEFFIPFTRVRRP